MAINKRDDLYIFVIIIFLGMINFNLIKSDPFVDYDDVKLVGSLQDLKGIGDYFLKVKSNYILDIQPVRDLSYLCDIYFYKLTGVSVFHFTNFTIFICIIFFYRRILYALKLDSKITYIAICMFSFHPIMTSSVGWIASRKHLLGVFFILWMFSRWLERKGLNKLDYLLFGLAMLSHQIFLLIPIWIWIYQKMIFKKIIRKEIITLLIISLILLSIGYLKTFWLGMGNSTLLNMDTLEIVSRFVLSLGRGFAQILFPISVSITYFQGNVLNLIGIVLGIIFIYLIVKKENLMEAKLWLSLFFICLAPTIITFVIDNYLILPLLGFSTATACIFSQQLSTKKWQWIKVFSLIYILLLGIKSNDSLQMWKNPIALWSYSYQNEDDPHLALMLASKLKEKDNKLALDIMLEGLERINLQEYPWDVQVVLDILLTSPHISKEEKRSIINKYYFKERSFDRALEQLQ